MSKNLRESVGKCHGQKQVTQSYAEKAQRFTERFRRNRCALRVLCGKKFSQEALGHYLICGIIALELCEKGMRYPQDATVMARWSS